jgi:quercetin dioxygenase-like cupin family protein
MSGLVVLPDEGKSVQFGGTGAIYKLLGEQTNGTLALVEHTVVPNTLAAPPHTHRDEDEISYVLEGELTIQVGEQLIQAPVGTLVMKPRGIQHCFWNAGSARARLLEIITPAGLEQYFEELASLVALGGPPDPARRSALYEKYHLTLDRAAAEALLEHYHLKW